MGFNRTLVELKLGGDIADVDLRDCFNRTLVELKLRTACLAGTLLSF